MPERLELDASSPAGVSTRMNPPARVSPAARKFSVLTHALTRHSEPTGRKILWLTEAEVASGTSTRSD